jgi:hypothetical protein
VFKRAWKDTWAFVRNEAAVEMVLLVLVVVIASAWQGPGDALGGGRVLAVFVFPLAAVGALVVLVGLWNLVQAPIRLSREQATEHAKALAARDARIREFEDRAPGPLEPRIVFKDRLVRFIDDGWDQDGLRMSPETKDTILAWQQSWAEEVYEFLRDAIGEGEATMFAGWAWGLVPDRTEGAHGPRARMEYLEPLLKARVDTVALRPQFDVERWSA